MQQTCKHLYYNEFYVQSCWILRSLCQPGTINFIQTKFEMLKKLPFSILSGISSTRKIWKSSARKISCQTPIEDTRNQEKKTAIDENSSNELIHPSDDPIHPHLGHRPQWMSPAEAVAMIKNDTRVYVHGIAATPTLMLDNLCSRALKEKLRNINLYHMYLEGNVEWSKPEYRGVVKSNCFFASANVRNAIASGQAEAISIFLSEVPWLFRKNIVNLDFALIHVSPPDKNGYCTLGTSVDCTRAAIINAKHVIAMANPIMPRTFGDGIIHSSHIDTMVFADKELHVKEIKEANDVEIKIGQKIAEELVEDGATLEVGVNAIHDVATASLRNHKNLGIHTEIFSDALLNLVECGAVTNALKYVHPGKIVTTAAYGSKRLYSFIHNNPMIVMGDIEWVNDQSVIRKNPKVTAINRAIEVDLTGQVVSDSIGKEIVSGFGGQVDFIRGASLSNDGRGKPIIALPSTTKSGESRIVPYIKDGGGVVVTRGHIYYVVTEYGVADLFGKSMRQRAYELIKIAHPYHREWLERMAYQRLKCVPQRD